MDFHISIMCKDEQNEQLCTFGKMKLSVSLQRENLRGALIPMKGYNHYCRTNFILHGNQ